MSSKMPPVPPQNRSPSGPGGDAPQAQQGEHLDNRQKINPDKVGQSGNSKVNTTHQGYQQDR